MKINNFDEEKSELLREIAFVKREIYELEKEEAIEEAVLTLATPDEASLEP